MMQPANIHPVDGFHISHPVFRSRWAGETVVRRGQACPQQSLERDENVLQNSKRGLKMNVMKSRKGIENRFR